jgi:hypothetical protein
MCYHSVGKKAYGHPNAEILLSFPIHSFSQKISERQIYVTAPSILLPGLLLSLLVWPQKSNSFLISCCDSRIMKATSTDKAEHH